MSLPALQAFVASAGTDEQLRAKLQSASGLDDVVTLARSHGHEVSKATLLKAHAQAVLSAPDHRLEAINNWGDALMHCFAASDHD
ncbi:MAG: Nif11-like leader peptide family natural product precursor [Cyanobium sp.]